MNTSSAVTMQLFLSTKILFLQDSDVGALEMFTVALLEMHLQTGKENPVNRMTSGFRFIAN